MSSPSSAAASILDRFERAWAAGQRPVIEDYLPADSLLRAAVLPNLVMIDMERRLRSGEDMHGEDYLQRFPDLEQEPERIVSLCEVEYRLRGGSDAVRADIVRRYRPGRPLRWNPFGN